MPTFFLAFLAAALATMGARDQLLVARLRDVSGAHSGLLIMALGVAAVTAALAAWLSITIGASLPSAAKQMMVGFALILSAGELMWTRRAAAPKEPTRSLGAIGIVLAGYAVTDAARFLIFAIAAASAVPEFAAAGGALGAGAALLLGWAMGSALAERRWLGAMRVAIGVLLGVVGIVLALDARGLI